MNQSPLEASLEKEQQDNFKLCSTAHNEEICEVIDYDDLIIEENINENYINTEEGERYYVCIDENTSDVQQISSVEQYEEKEIEINQPTYVIVLPPNNTIKEDQTSRHNFFDNENICQKYNSNIDEICADQTESHESTSNINEQSTVINDENQFYEILNYDDLIIEESTDECKESNIFRKIFVCTYSGCGKKYAAKTNLQVHMRTHAGIKPFVCDICGQRFNTSYSCQTHKRTHTGERPYECTMDGCSKAFKTSSDLGKHIRTHTGNRPFKCLMKDCEMYFTTLAIRKVHMRTHSGERPFSCNFCGKTFSNLTNRNNHERIHKGERPYQCQICDRSFTEYSSLFKHKQVHKDTQLFECPVCNRQYKKAQSVTVHIEKCHPNHHIELVDPDDNENI